MGKLDLQLWIHPASLESILYAKQFLRHFNKFEDHVNLKIMMQISDSNSYAIPNELIDHYCIMDGRYCLDMKSYSKRIIRFLTVSQTPRPNTILQADQGDELHVPEEC